jgi:fermentation-respiration switch protein FrsA (DUF1100 family)
MLKFILIVAAAYGLLVAVVYLMQGRMLYLANVPGRELTASPADLDVEYEDVFIETADGVRLHGWFIPGSSARVLLFFHGNAGNISHRLDSIRQFLGLGLSVFIIDYRGYGQSGGKTTEKGIYRDANAAWRYLREERSVEAADIIIFGRSMGASAAAKLATKQQPLATIVESSFTSIPDIAQEIYDYVRDVRSPVLVIHGRDDEIVPFHHGEAIFEAANEPRTQLVLRGGHNDAYIRDEVNYIKGLRAFLSDLGQ